MMKLISGISGGGLVRYVTLLFVSSSLGFGLNQGLCLASKNNIFGTGRTAYMAF